jgi:hypothetical protein
MVDEDEDLRGSDEQAASSKAPTNAVRMAILVNRDDGRLADVLESIGRRYLDIAPLLRRATRDAFAP